MVSLWRDNERSTERQPTVDPAHDQALEEGNDQDDTAAGVVVEELEDVHASLCGARR